MHATMRGPQRQYVLQDALKNMHLENYACYNEESATTTCLQDALQHAYCQLCMLQ